MVRIAIITYSLYGHTEKLAKAIQAGIKSAGGSADLYRVAETLSDEVLEKMNAPPKTEVIPTITINDLENYDAFLFGVPTRFGTCSAQWSTFWDRTGGIWVKGGLVGKAAGFFVSTASMGGGQESTVKACLNYLVHHGIIYVPLGYNQCFTELANIKEVHGSSPWGAGTLAGPDNSRLPSDLELRIANIQGKTFFEIVSKIYGDETLKKNETSAKSVEHTKSKADIPNSNLKKVKSKEKGKKKSSCIIC